MSKLKDLTGRRFGRLTVVERAEDCILSSGRKFVQWKCVCDCGNTTYVTSVHLINGDNVSCGCYGKERRTEATVKREKTHGMSRQRIYHLFQNMKYRCTSPKSPQYKQYGGRGIKVCDEWLSPDGFERFYQWSLENGYDDSLSIDRIDVNGDYTPENCRWTDWETQYNNTTKTVRLTYNGKTQSAAQWAREIGVDRHTIYDRIRKGLPIEEVLSPKKR